MIKTFSFCILMIVPQLILAQNGVAIIKNYIDSTGGIENWRKIKSMYQESQARYKENQYGLPTVFSLENEPFNVHVTYRKWHPDKQKSAIYRNGSLKMETYAQGTSCYRVFPNRQPIESTVGPKYELLIPVELFNLINSKKEGIN